MLSVTPLGQEYVQVILAEVVGVELLMQEAEPMPAFVKYCCTASAATLIEHGVQGGGREFEQTGRVGGSGATGRPGVRTTASRCGRNGIRSHDPSGLARCI